MTHLWLHDHRDIRDAAPDRGRLHRRATPTGRPTRRQNRLRDTTESDRQRHAGGATCPGGRRGDRRADACSTRTAAATRPRAGPPTGAPSPSPRTPPRRATPCTTSCTWPTGRRAAELADAPGGYRSGLHHVPIWSANGSAYVFWATGEGTSTSLFRVSVESGAVIAQHRPRAGATAPGHFRKTEARWAWVHTSPDWPSEIYTATTDGEPVRLTDANAWLRDEDVQLGKVETVRWTNSDGDPVEGVLTKPVGYEEGAAYPFIVNPHGGPTGRVARRLQHRRPVLRRQRLRRPAAQLPGQHQLRPGVRQRQHRQLGHHRLRRRDDRRGPCHRDGLGRSGPADLLRLELRRVPVGLDRHPDRPLPGGLAGSGPHQPLQHVQHERHPGLSGVVLRRHAVDRHRQLPRALPHDLRGRRRRARCC